MSGDGFFLTTTNTTTITAAIVCIIVVLVFALDVVVLLEVEPPNYDERSAVEGAADQVRIVWRPRQHHRVETVTAAYPNPMPMLDLVVVVPPPSSAAPPPVVVPSPLPPPAPESAADSTIIFISASSTLSSVSPLPLSPSPWSAGSMIGRKL